MFSTVDAKNGFWHVELDDDSSRLTTFNSPFGRFRWLRLPFGLCTAPEEFQRRLNHALVGLKGVRTIHDDILVFGEGSTEDEALVDHDRNLRSLMQRCRERNVKLNKAESVMLSPCFIPESIFYTQFVMLSPRFIPESVFYTQSLVRSP